MDLGCKKLCGNKILPARSHLYPAFLNSLHPTINREDPKVVASTSHIEPKWEGTSVVLRNNVRDEIQRLKSMSGKSIAIFGSNDLCVSLMEMGLVDEFRLMTNPIALGSGRSLFSGLKTKVQLQLISTQKFNSGNVLNCYST